MPKAVGTLIVSPGSEGTVFFGGFDKDSKANINGNGSLNPQIPYPGVNDTSAVLTYDSLDTLPGRYDIVSSASYAGEDAVSLHFRRSQGGAEVQVKVDAVCTLSNRTVIESGWIEFGY
jgi:hypothetical protein